MSSSSLPPVLVQEQGTEIMGGRVRDPLESVSALSRCNVNEGEGEETFVGDDEKAAAHEQTEKMTVAEIIGFRRLIL